MRVDDMFGWVLSILSACSDSTSSSSVIGLGFDAADGCSCNVCRKLQMSDRHVTLTATGLK